MVFRRKYTWGLILAGIILSACGYRFAGTGSLPGAAKSVFIDILENRTGETGIENTFTADLRYEFVRNRMDAARNEADGILSGEINSLRVGTISRRGEHTSQERRVTVSVELTLRDQGGKIIWVRKISESESYVVLTDDRATEANKREAINKLSKRLAESAFYRLTDDF